MDRLINSLNQVNISISDEQINQFKLYYDLLISWNEKINLTSITDLGEVIDKHFVDSAMLLQYKDLSNLSLIDIGTGAGFPGIPLKILCPSLKVTLLDSLNKRINFLNEVIESLQLNDIVALHGRAEDYALNIKYREKYDIATSRAVANLSSLSEYCLPFVKDNGMFIPYKSGNVDEEISNAKCAFGILGGKLIKDERFSIPNSDFDRSLLFIKKVKKTPKSYPRKAGTPTKNPL